MLFYHQKFYPSLNDWKQSSNHKLYHPIFQSKWHEENRAVLYFIIMIIINGIEKICVDWCMCNARYVCVCVWRTFGMQWNEEAIMPKNEILIVEIILLVHIANRKIGNKSYLPRVSRRDDIRFHLAVPLEWNRIRLSISATHSPNFHPCR